MTNDRSSIPLDPCSPDDPGDSHQERQTWLTDKDHHYLFNVLMDLEEERNLTRRGLSAVSQLRVFVEETYRGPDAS